MNSSTNTIHWCSSTYDAIRANFINKNLNLFVFASMRRAFDDELDRFGGKIIDEDNSKILRAVVDTLGMNNYKYIVFSSEENMLMFLLKWA